MKVIEISEHAPDLSVYADAGDIVVYHGVEYRVVASPDDSFVASPDDVLCRYCACDERPGCGCLPFYCFCRDKYPNGTHLVRVCPEEGGEE